MKISKAKEKKQKIINEITDKVGKAKAMVFTNFQGMTHVQLEQLKKSLKPTAELVVTKNTLLGRSLQSSKFKVQSSKLIGPTATLFAYADPISPLKALAKSIKNLKLPEIKFGIFEDKMLTAEEVMKLASLPSRETLLAQVAYGLKSPIYGLHKALSWNVQKLVMTLSAVQQKKI